MSQGILAFRKGLFQQCQCHKIIVFVVKAQPLGNSRQDMFILHLCLKYDIVVWSRVIFYRHTIWLEMERIHQIAKLL